MKTKLTLILCVVLALCLVAGCGEAKEAPAAKITGVYLSPASYEYNNMRPDYNFYLLSYAQSEVTLYDNNTYEVIVSASTFSGIELSESTNDATANERTNSITKFFGTYTSKTNDLDDDLLDVTLAKPTRIVKSFDQRYWLDTANWTETMGKYVIPAETDPTTGAAIAGTGDPWTAQQYLDANAFAETTIQVNVNDGAQWIVQGESLITGLTVSDGAMVKGTLVENADGTLTLSAGHSIIPAGTYGGTIAAVGGGSTVGGGIDASGELNVGAAVDAMAAEQGTASGNASGEASGNAS